MFKKRMKMSLGVSFIFGLLCILVFIFRHGISNNHYQIIALWYNRILMGILIGMAADRKGIMVLFRGALLGFFVSLAYFLTTGLADIYTFIAGIIIGLIIDGAASQYSNFLTRKTRQIINKATSSTNNRR